MTESRHKMQPIDASPYERRSQPSQDPNFQNLVANWGRYRDNLVVVLGAGASVGARSDRGEPFPTAYHLRNALWREFMQPPASFDERDLGLMTLEHAASLCIARADQVSVKDFVAAYFVTYYTPWYHAVLPFLNPQAVFTTNYDRLVELGWNLQTGKQTRQGKTICQLEPLYRYTISLNDAFTPLYKPHGTVQYHNQRVTEGGLVLSFFDYFVVLNERDGMLDQFMEKFGRSCVLFIGYNLMDLDIATRLYQIRQEQKGPRWYAVFPRPDEDVRRMYQENYSMLPIAGTFNDFMRDLDEAVDFIPDNWKHDKIPSLAKATQIMPPGQ